MAEFHSVRRLPPYVFEQVNRLKAAARNAGADIIDLGMGNPDLPAPKHVVEKLVETAGKPRTDRYSASKGIAGLRRAQANYYGRRFGVKLDPERQVVATLGSKEGFANMAQAITAPGDVVLVPNPSYPIHAFGFLMAGGVIRSVPAEPTPDYFVALERAVIHSIPKPLAVVVCYPSNPTAMVASLDFYRDLVAFAKKHEIFVLSDLAYAEVYFDDNPPPSMLQIPGAMDVTVEFTSMSKTYSMPGWRIGFAVGNERLLAALTRVKSYLDYGAFTPIQVAAAAALNGPDDCINEMRAIYKARRDVMVESFGQAGWIIPAPTASMFAWVPIPPKFRRLGSLEFSKLLVEKADVAVAPGIGFGEHGDEYVRLALVENEQRIRQAARGIRRFFETADERLHNVVQLKQPAWQVGDNEMRDRTDASLTSAFAGARRITVLTGAGISTECGVPDFRSPGSPWLIHKPIGFAEFLASGATRAEAWRRKFAMDDLYRHAKPGRCHHALVQLSQSGRLQAVVTQNIDGLHQAAGLDHRHLIELHGNGTFARCLSCERRFELDEVRTHLEQTGEALDCRCGGFVKSATIAFGQSLKQSVIDAAVEAARACDLFIAIGSSLVVRPAATLPLLARANGAVLMIVNREPTPLDDAAHHLIHGEAGEVLQALADELHDHML